MPQNRKKPRRVEHLEAVKEKIYIFCEGQQTEPLYFKGFAEAIKSNAVYKNLVHVHVEGVGAETLRVINFAEDYVKSHQLKKATVWCVYDKDSFPKQNFNAVSERASVLNNQQKDVVYNVAWSNQCIEYWFILHFEFYQSDNDRKDYRKFLHEKFEELGWARYEKNNAELFSIMTEKGNPKRAIKWAERRLKDCAGLTESQSVPATKVHLLVQKLAKYLPDELRSKYL